MDEADNAQMSIETVIDINLANAMREAANIPVGEAGECNGCGEFFSRTVDGYCGFCRDKFNKYLR
jgi:hypothetical protein